MRHLLAAAMAQPLNLGAQGVPLIKTIKNTNQIP
jgi:hypothetical protein